MADLTISQIKEGWALLAKNNLKALNAACRSIFGPTRKNKKKK